MEEEPPAAAPAPLEEDAARRAPDAETNGSTERGARSRGGREAAKTALRRDIGEKQKNPQKKEEFTAFVHNIPMAPRPAGGGLWNSVALRKQK